METAHLRSANKRIFRALLSLASAMLLIRMMGMLNQVIVTARFGAGATMDAYFVASMVPLLLGQLITGIMEASVIPVYARVRTQGTKEQASLLFSTLLNLLLIGAVLFTLVMFIFRRQMIFFSAPALDPFRTGLAINLVPFILPALLLLAVIGFLECIFNTEGQFGWPAYAGILVPITTAILVLVAGKSLGVVMLCVGMVIGLGLQLCVFIIRVRRIGLIYRPSIHLRQPEVILVLIAAWPALLGSLIGQISPLIDQVFASFLSTGSISALNYALKLISLPVGVIFISVGRAAVPYLSGQAAINDMKAFKETLRLYLWAVGIGTTVLSIFMLILAHPLVQIFFQRGQFSADDTNHTATTLIGFVVGLTPTALVFILVRAFSALGKNHVLMYAGIFNVVANAIFDYIFARLWQSQGIALATSLMYLCAMFILLFTLRRMIGTLNLFTFPPEILKVLRKPGLRRYYPRWNTWKKENRSFGISSGLRRKIIRIGLMIVVFAAGVTGVFLNSLYTLRAALGSLAILAFLRYRYALLIVWVLIGPLIGSNLPVFNGNNFLTGLTAPTLLLMTYIPVKPAFKRLPALAFLLIFLLWMFAGIGISPIGIGAFLTTWSIYLDYVALGVLTLHVLTTERRTMGLIDAILLLSTFIGLYGIYGYFTRQNGIPDPVVGFRIFSVFDTSPSLALLLSMAIPLALYRALTLRGFKRIGILIVMLILLVALGLTFTRSTYISVPLSIIIMACFLPSRKEKIALLSILLTLAVLLVLLTTVGNIPIFNRFFEQDFTTLNGRINLWQVLLDHFDPTQLLGNGLQAADVLLAKTGANGIKGFTAFQPHSLFLGILYDQGIIGASLLMLIALALFVGLIAGIRKTTGGHRMLFATTFAIFISVFIQSIDSSDILAQGFGIHFWIIMALPFALCWSAPKQLSETDGDPLYDDEETVPRMRAIQQTRRE